MAVSFFGKEKKSRQLDACLEDSGWLLGKVQTQGQHEALDNGVVAFLPVSPPATL